MKAEGNPITWLPAGVFDIPPMDPKAPESVAPSEWMQSRSLDVTETDQAIYDRINEKHGTNVEMRMKQFFEQQTPKGQ